MVDGILAFFLSPIQTVLFSYFRLSRDKIDFKFMAIILFLRFCLIAGLGTLLFDLYGEQLIKLLLGQKWAPGYVTLVPLTIYAAIILYFEVIVSMAQAINQMWPVIFARISWIVASCGLTVPPITAHYKLLGAGWATALGSVVMLGAGIFFLCFRVYASMKVDA